MAAGGEPGSALTLLPANVRHLEEEPAVFAAMLEGWTRQQQARHLKPSTIKGRIDLVKRFHRFTNSYPWQWEPADLEAWSASLVSGAKPVEPSTLRSYQTELGLFCEYLVDARYDWANQCSTRFAAVPQQICHEWNTVAHNAAYEGRPGRRALTYDELQALFDAADERVERIRSLKRKGVLAAHRDAITIKTIYAFGLRRREACGLELADLRRNPNVPTWGRFGALEVRWGKGVSGSRPRRRTVLLVPEFDWLPDLMRLWVDELRSGFNPGAHPALWMTERAGRVQVSRLDENFAEIRAAAGLPDELTLHSLRHSYITHLLEFGYPELFVQQQAGHNYASTTAIYSHVGDGYRNRLLTSSLARQLGERSLDAPASLTKKGKP